jgi:hypothetical protein
MVSAANSSGLLNLKTPLGALPTAVLYPLIIYAVFIFLSSALSKGEGFYGLFFLFVIHFILN